MNIPNLIRICLENINPSSLEFVYCWLLYTKDGEL